MSRFIDKKSSISLSQAERSYLNTADGKLIITKYMNHDCALVISNNRLLYTYFYDTKSDIDNIYIGKIKNKLNNIDAYFVEINPGIMCFLPSSNIKKPIITNRKYDGRILQGDELLVQITKDAQKNKLATVTTSINFNNEYFAFVFDSNKISFSNKLSNQKKEAIKDILLENNLMECDMMLPGNLQFGVIFRTECENLAIDMCKDLFCKYVNETTRFLTNALHASCYTCLKKASISYSSILGKQIPYDAFQDVVTDNEAAYKELCELKVQNSSNKLNSNINISFRKLEEGNTSLNVLFGIDTKIKEALSERIWLKSGGFLIIQPTEALTVIDVNSGKYEATGHTAEEGAYFVNKEAALEIAIQLRLRNISGIILIDFINMKEDEHNKCILQYMTDLVSNDFIPTKIVDMTSLGLVEITRKKTYKSLYEQVKEI